MPNDASSHIVSESIENGSIKGRNLALNAETTSSDSAMGAVGKGSASAIAALGLPKFETPEQKRRYFLEHMAGAFRYMGGEGIAGCLPASV